MSDGPFHEGEIAVQERTGERDRARRQGVGIASRVLPGALAFLDRQRVLAVSIVGDDGLWTSVWCGEPGFVRSIDGARVHIRTSSIDASPQDPVRARLTIGRRLGVLAIDLATRRRLRINGAVEAVSPDEIRVTVHECVANCPKYIQRRELVDIPAAPPSGEHVVRGRVLDGERRALVERADTAFVGSVHPSRGADASHRGGEPGFIRVVDATTLRMPDYPGNSMFMTLGNFEIDPRASLAVVDFERGRLLSLSGSARLRFGEEEPRHATGGTGRYWELEVGEWIEIDVRSATAWQLIEPSPYNPRTR